MSDTPGLDLEMIVESVRIHMPTGRHVLLLKEVGHGRVLPIWIGPWEASAIAMRLQGMTPERPLTHDLLAAVIARLGARVDRVIIGSLTEETFHARIVLVTPDARHEMDARPSDAIALAVRLDVPIYASSEVLDRAAALPDADAEDDEDAEDDDEPEAEPAAGDAARPTPPTRRARAGLPRETTGEHIDPTKLGIFRDFVNSLDMENDQRGGGGGSTG